MRRPTCLTALGVASEARLGGVTLSWESQVTNPWRALLLTSNTKGDEWTARRVVQCKDLFGHAMILKTEEVQSIVALAEAVKAFRQTIQLLGSVQSENTKAVEQWSGA